MKNTIEDYRNQFKKGPIGRWWAATGSFNNVMNAFWEFRPDGMGSIQMLGPFLYPQDEPFYFEWKAYADFTMQIKRLYFLDDAGEEEWVKVRYDFEVVTHDTGSEIAMVEVEEDGKHKAGFGYSFLMVHEWPLAYLGTAKM